MIPAALGWTLLALITLLSLLKSLIDFRRQRVTAEPMFGIEHDQKYRTPKMRMLTARLLDANNPESQIKLDKILHHSAILHCTLAAFRAFCLRQHGCKQRRGMCTATLCVAHHKNYGVGVVAT
jgi:hypothetical protein